MTRSAADLLREIARVDPEGHAAALGRAYLGEIPADSDPVRIPTTSEPQCASCGRILSCVGTCSKGCAQ